MSNFVKLLLSVLFMFHVGKGHATLDFFHGQIYIPFFDYLWKFEDNCIVGCHYFSFKCFFPASAFSVCRDLRFMHECCEQFRSTTTTSTSTTTPSTTTTSTTTTTTTSTTTPSTTSSTEDPLELCNPTPPAMCQPEPGCSLSPYYPFWNKWLRQPGCEHKCWEHCFDQCACKTAASGNCEYDPSSGMCIARPTCGEMSFKDGECRRENAYYSIGGLLCHNKESSQTNCDTGTVIFGINIAGAPDADKRGIFYVADDEAFYKDEYITRMNDSRIVDDVEDEDKTMYGTFASGKTNGKYKGQCLYYIIKVEQDGEYELSVRAVEPHYQRVGERIFSLTLNQVPIALHVDLYSLAGRFTPVDIIANFMIRSKSDGGIRRSITVKGHPSMDYQSDLEVGLCISDCHLCEEYNHLDPGYVGSGLSLVRF